MRRAFAAGLVVLMVAAGAARAETIIDDDGVLNPRDMTVDYSIKRMDDPVFDPKLCMTGFPALKLGERPAARKIFERCAREGVTVPGS